MKATCLLFLAISCAALMHGTSYAAPSSPAIRLSKFENSSSGQRGSAAPLCGKPPAFRPGPPISLSQRRLEGCAFQTTLRKLVNVQAPRKGEAFPHSGAAEPLVSTHPVKRNLDKPSPASQPTSPESSANTASDHPRDPAQRDAAPADGVRHQTGGKASHEQRDHGRGSDTNHPPSRASLTKVDRPKQLPNSRQRSLPGNGMNFHQPGSNKSAGAAKSGFIPNEGANIALAVRTPSVVRPSVPSFNNGRHRGPNPAVVGGSPNSHRSNTGAINGTRMNRKP